MSKLFTSAIVFTIASVTSALADNAADIAEGLRLARINCESCHVLGAEGESPLVAAPAFRDLPASYDEGELEDAFNDGVVTAHPAMPDWQMTPDQARQIAAFIMSLSGKPQSQ